MAAREQMYVEPAGSVGNEGARDRILHAHRMAVEQRARPAGRRTQMERHRGTIGHLAVLIGRIVAREEWRRRGEQVEEREAKRWEADRPRRQAPFAGHARG